MYPCTVANFLFWDLHHHIFNCQKTLWIGGRFLGCTVDDVRHCPGIFIRIISTDVPLVFFWALALWAYVNLLERVNWQWAAVLGLSLGLGMLAKYAMGYFLLSMLLAAGLDSRAHRLMKSRAVWLAHGIAAIIVAPNLIWVLQHNLATFRNIAAAATTDEGLGFHPVAALEFLAAQFVIFGPVVFTVLLYAITKGPSTDKIPASKIMLAFASSAGGHYHTCGFILSCLRQLSSDFPSSRAQFSQPPR